MTALANPCRIELAVLDMAGTTIEEGGAVYEALAAAVAAGGHPAPDDSIQRWMGTDKREAISGLIEEASGSVPDSGVVEALYGEFRATLLRSYSARPPAPIAGVPGCIAALRAGGVKVALTTGFARDVAESLLGGLGWTVAPDGVGGTVDAVVCADDVVSGRPAADMILAAMAATGIRSVERVAVAGDTIVDLRAGMNAGARIVAGVATGKLTHADLELEPHTHLIGSVAELPAVIAGLR